MALVDHQNSFTVVSLMAEGLGNPLHSQQI